MPTNILLLPLLAGYCFLHIFHYTRFRSKRLDGYRLLLDSAFVGVVFAVVAWGIASILARIECVLALWSKAAPQVPFLGTAVISLAFGWCGAHLLNWSLSRSGLLTEQDSQLRAIDRYGDQMLRLFASAQQSAIPVCLTLSSRKVYTGYVVGLPLEAHDHYVAIVPLMSGYRDTGTLALKYTVNYTEAIQGNDLDPSDFVISIDMRQMTHAGYFDLDLQPLFQVETEGNLTWDQTGEPSTD